MMPDISAEIDEISTAIVLVGADDIIEDDVIGEASWKHYLNAGCPLTASIPVELPVEQQRHGI